MKRILYSIDKRIVAAVLTEWDRRFRESPSSFVNIADHLLFSDPRTYGEESAPYFLALLEELYPSGSLDVL